IPCDYDHLQVRLEEVSHGNAVGSCKDAKLFGYARESLERLLGLVSIGRIPGVAMHSQQCDSGHWIPRRSGRVLQRLTPCGENAESLAIRQRLSVEEASRSRVEKLRDHGVGNSVSESEI